jgi:hypothetical protein
MQNRMMMVLPTPSLAEALQAAYEAVCCGDFNDAGRLQLGIVIDYLQLAADRQLAEALDLLAAHDGEAI